MNNRFPKEADYGRSLQSGANSMGEDAASPGRVILGCRGGSILKSIRATDRRRTTFTQGEAMCRRTITRGLCRSLCLLVGLCPVWAAAQQGKILSLDGFGDYVDVPDSGSLDILNQITVESCINFQAGGTENDPRILSK